MTDERLPERDLYPLDDYHDDSKREVREKVRKFVTRPLMNVVLDATVVGEDNVAGLDGAFIVVGNHSSHLDAPMVFSLLPNHMTERLATGAAADYWFRRPAISKVTSLFFNTYPIERKGKRTGPNTGRAAGMTGRLLRDGIPILIFPEGTRSRTGEIGDFKPGAAALSMKFNVPIIPLGLDGGREAMPVGAMLPKVGQPSVSLFIGKPMRGKPGENAEDFIDRVRTHIIAMLEQKTANPVTDDAGGTPEPPSST